MHIIDIPIEILGHIVYIGTHDDRVSIHSAKTHYRQFAGPRVTRAVAVLYSFPRLASRVCKRWRTVVRNDVRFWNVDLTLMRYPRSQSQLQKLALQINAIIPEYDLHILIADRVVEPYRFALPLDAPSISDRFSLVSLVSSSLRSLRLRLDCGRTPDFENLLEAGFPNLRMLGIDANHFWKGPLSLERSSLPCLDELLLHNCEADLTCAKNLRPLRRLSFTAQYHRQGTWGKLQHVIDLQTNLEALNLSLYRVGEISFHGISNPASISFNYLTSCRLSYVEGLIGNFLLRYSLPNLQVLQIKYEHYILGAIHIPALQLPDVILLPNLRILQLPLTDFSFNILKQFTLSNLQTLALIPCMLSFQNLRDSRMLCMPSLTNLIINNANPIVDNGNHLEIMDILAALDPLESAFTDLQQLILPSLMLSAKLGWSDRFARLKYIYMQVRRGEPGMLDDIFAGAKELTQVEFAFDGIQHFKKTCKLIAAGFSTWAYPSRFIITSTRTLKANQRSFLAKALCNMVKSRVDAKLPLLLLRLHLQNAVKLDAGVFDTLSEVVEENGGRFERSRSMRPWSFDWTTYTANLED